MNILDRLKFIYGVRKLPDDTPQIYTIDQLGAAYIQIPKVASRSIRAAITRRIAGEKCRDENLSALVTDYEKTYAHHLTHEQISHLSDKYFIFAVVRNPYDRIISCYKNKVGTALKTGGSHIFQRYGLARDVGFKEFIDFVCETPDKHSDRHFRSQAWFLTWNDLLLPSYVARLESLEKDWKKIFENTGIPLPEVSNSSQNISSIEINEELMSKLYARYKKDFLLFNYSR